MARIWSSGFELNSLTANVELTSVSSGNIQTAVVRSGTYAAKKTSGTSTTRYFYQFASANQTAPFFFRIYLRVEVAPSIDTGYCIQVIDALGNTKVGIIITSGMVLQLWNMEDSTQVGSNSSALSLDTWYRIELKCDTTTVSSTVIESLIDGTSFASGTINLANGIRRFDFGGGLTSGDTTFVAYFDDIAINDSSGSFQNSWPGTGSIVHLKPNAAGDNTAWTPSAGSNYQCVDDPPADGGPNDATDYVSSSTTGQIDDYNLDASGLTDETISVVQVGWRARYAVVANSVRLRITGGGATQESTNISFGTLNTWYTNDAEVPRNYQLTLYDLPGASTTAWTPSDLDAAQIGVYNSGGSGSAIDVSTMWLLVDYAPAVGTTTSTSSTTTSSSTSTTRSTSSSTSTSKSTSTTTTRSTSTSSTTTSKSTSTTKSTSTSITTTQSVTTSTSSTTTSKSTSTTRSISTTRSTSTSTSSTTTSSSTTTTLLTTAAVLGPRAKTQMKVGSFTGSGVTRLISGIGFRPSLVWIWGASQYAVWSSEVLPSDTTLYFDNAAVGFTGGITGFFHDGFSLGTSSVINANGTTYYYICFRDNGAGDFDVGSYIGDGTDNRAITGLGFKPDFVHIKGNTAQLGSYRHSNSASDTSYLFTGATATDHIQELLTDGFQIGTHARVNSSGTTYYYFAFKKNKDLFEIDSYTGNGTNGRNIPTIFQPELVMIQNRTATQTPVYMNLSSSIVGSTLRFSNTTALTTAILGILSTGFQLGTHATVNSSSVVYDYFIWKNPKPTEYTYKYYEYKVYDTNVYQKSWTTEVLTEPTFRNVINGGPGEVVVRLARSFDDFGEGDDVKLNNRVDIYCYDREYPNGLLLYKGFISGYRPVLEGSKEFVEITLLSYVYELGYYILRDDTGATRIAYNSQDPSDILKDVIAKYRADGGNINYTASSIQTCGTTVSYTFNTNTVREAIDKIVELAPEGWYWTIDANCIIYFKSRLTSATHTFTIGTHINQMETWRRIEDVVNRVYFTGFTTASGTGLYRVYSSSGSITNYGLHAIQKTDGRVTLSATADTMSNRILNAKSAPEIRTVLTILDNNGEAQYKGYDIESVVPGDTMQIRNLKGSVKTYTRWDQFSWDQDVWDQTLTTSAADVIQILSLDYEPEKMRLEASSRLPEIAKRIEDIERNRVAEILKDNPENPVAG